MPELTKWRESYVNVSAGPIILLDGPAELLLTALHILKTTAALGNIVWEGPLRSFASNLSCRRVLIQGYMPQDTPSMILSMTIGALRSIPGLKEFAVGSQSLFDDSTSKLMEVSSVHAIMLVKDLLEEAVIVSHRLVLIRTSHTPEDWRERITQTHLQDPDTCVVQISSRESYDGGQLWARPVLLTDKAKALRAKARLDRLPYGTSAADRETLQISLNGALGPDPEQLAIHLIHYLQVPLKRVLQVSTIDAPPQREHARLGRHGDGTWNGVLQIRLEKFSETQELHAMSHGGSVNISGSVTMMSA